MGDPSGFIGAIGGGIGDPALDGRFMPASAVDADRHLPGECPVRDLAVEGGAGKAGAGQHGLETDNPFMVGH